MYEPNNALEEFELIAKDWNLTKETFGKLRNILMTELVSHKNDADYAKYTDIGYIQGSLTLPESIVYLYVQNCSHRLFVRTILMIHTNSL